MKVLRTLLVDDEEVARTLLRRLLAPRRDVEIVGECENGDVAVDAIGTLRPDLVLLDVQMPGRDGLEVVEALAAPERPAVVFVTAHDEYAVRAFEVHAVDYLLKPVDEGRLGEALDRVQAAQDADLPARQRRLEECLQATRGRGSGSEWLVVRRGDERVPLSARKIEWVESAGNYVKIHAGGEVLLMRAPLGELEQRLDSDRFVRVHRTALIQIERMAHLLPSGHGDFQIVMEDGTRIPLSRRYRPQLERVIGSLG